LDAAALASTAPLDLSDPATAPDFVALSFYKIFGFPNIGALLVRKESAHVLESRKFFGGGTVEMVIAVNDVWHAKKETSIHDRLEDGTLPFHSIFALDHAMNVHERLYGPNPMKFISHHTAQLGKMVYDGLVALVHSNGTPLCRIYKDESAVYGDPSMQGATVAFNVQRPDGTLVGFEDVEEAADERNIYVRSGSLCNPGGVATYLNWSPAEMKAAYASGHRCSNPTQIMLGKPTGVVRVSLGAMSTAADVRTLLEFLDEVYVNVSNQHLSASTRNASTLAAPMSPKDSIDASGRPLSPLPQSTLAQSLISSTTLPALNMDSSDSRASERPWEAQSEARAKPPPFIPADYVKLRKPWEEEMRKNAAVYAQEMKDREVEDAHAPRTQTPSVKARKFGRSVVNLLRTKSHYSDARYDQDR
jgi:molybdenum cofactor sulfurtransferase